MAHCFRFMFTRPPSVPQPLLTMLYHEFLSLFQILKENERIPVSICFLLHLLPSLVRLPSPLDRLALSFPHFLFLINKSCFMQFVFRPILTRPVFSPYSLMHLSMECFYFCFERICCHSLTCIPSLFCAYHCLNK